MLSRDQSSSSQLRTRTTHLNNHPLGRYSPEEKDLVVDQAYVVQLPAEWDLDGGRMDDAKNGVLAARSF